MMQVGSKFFIEVDEESLGSGYASYSAAPSQCSNRVGREVISDACWSVPSVREEVRQMEPYINNSWTERCGNAYTA